VTIDGRDLRRCTLESIGQNVGVVFQDTFLWHASIRDNLLYARPDASEGRARGGRQCGAPAPVHRLAP
jgi:ATP-binding cassette subfamily B protein